MLTVERARREIGANYDTLRTAVDFLAAGQAGIRDHTIDAVKAMWLEMIALRDAHGQLRTFETMFTDEEIVGGFRGDGHDMVREWVAPYVSHADVQKQIMALSSSQIEVHRPFCGDRLWLIFYVHRAVHHRSAFLMNEAIGARTYRRLMQDSGIQQLLGDVIPQRELKAAIADTHRGFVNALARLEALFLQEATRVMTGSKAVSESLSDMHAAMLLPAKAEALRG